MPYYRPGDKRIAQDLAELAADNRKLFYWQIAQWFAVKACKKYNNMEELEETAKLIFILGDRPIRYLTAEVKLRN